MDARIWTDGIAEIAGLVKEKSPLVVNITNYVAMNFAANAMLAAGASPVMAHAPEEIDEMLAIAGALTLNFGTLDAAWVKAMTVAGLAAQRAGKPVVFDPVGAGATTYRTGTARGFLEAFPVAVLRGNASEIAAVAGAAGAATKGVDASGTVEAALPAAAELARRRGMVVAISGASDTVTDGRTVLRLAGGSPLMPLVTATGCALTAVTGACLAVAPDRPLLAAATAMAIFNAASGAAARVSKGPGTLAANFLDALHAQSPADILAGNAVTECPAP